MSVSKSITVNLTISHNPFDFNDFTKEKVIASEGDLLDSILTDIDESSVVSINGEIIDSKIWESKVLEDGDYVVIVPVPQGGDGGGKSILRIAALIAVSYFTFGQGAFALQSLFPSLAGAGLHVAQMLTFAAGSALINKHLPIEPNVPKIEPTLESSDSYGINGPKNTHEEGLVVPVVYGKYRVAGNLINLHVDNSDDQAQILYMRMVLSEGRIGHPSVSTILINDQSIDDFDNIETHIGDGGPNQTNCPWFDRTITSINVASTLTTSYTTRTTSIPVDRFRVDLVAPTGLRKLVGSSSEPIVEPVTIEYRKQGDTEWQELNATSTVSGYTELYAFHHSIREAYRQRAHVWAIDPTFYNDDLYYDNPNQELSLRVNTSGDILFDVFRYHNVTARNRDKKDPYWVTVGYVDSKPRHDEKPQMRGVYRNAYRASFESPDLEQGIYEVRVKRENEEATDDDLYIDTIQWADLNEIVMDETRVHNTATLSLKIKLNENLNSMPQVSVETAGVFVKNFRHEADSISESISVSSNPAWVAYDMLTNERYGGAFPESRIDINTWINWANFCEDNNLHFNGIFDSEMTLWDALLVVFRTGRAQPLNIGTMFSVTVDSLTLPSMMFNVGNIIEKSFSVSWLPLSDRANEIEVTYFDKLNNYLPHTIRVTDENVPGNGDKRRAELKLYGVTDYEQAVKEAKLLLNQNRLILQTVSFDVPTEAIGCRVGDVVFVQHDSPKWLVGGRLEQNSTDSSSGIVLDQEVDIEFGKDYSLLLHFDSAEVGSDTILTVLGSYVGIVGELPEENFKKVFVSGVEYDVLTRYTEEAGTFGVKVNPPIPASEVGNDIYFHDVDVIQARNFTSTTLGGDGSHKVISVDTPFSAPATKYMKYIFGEVDKVKKLYRMSSINHKSDFVSSLVATEYYDEIYDDSANSLVANTYSNYADSIGHIVDLEFSLEAQVIGTVLQPIVNLDWKKPDDERYMGAEVAFRLPNGDWSVDGYATRGQTSYQFRKGVRDQVFEFRVTSRDILGSLAAYNSSPTITVPIGNVSTSLVAPTNLEATTDGSSVTLTWDNPTSPFYLETEVFRGTVNDFNDSSVRKIASIAGESYNDLQFESGVINYYWVKAINSEGVSGEINDASGTTLPVPNNVTNLEISNQFLGSRAEITWDRSVQAYTYKVEVTTGGQLRRSPKTTSNFYAYGLEEMNADGHVNRNIDFEVYVENVFGMSSTGITLIASNAAPDLPTGLSIGSGFKTFSVDFNIPNDPDYLETRVYVDTVSGFAADDNTNLVSRSYGSPIIVEGLDEGETYYVRLRTFDSFGGGGFSGEWAVTTETLSSNGLSPWATVTQADRDFIDANLEDDAIPSEKIEKLVASKIVTGTLAATESISVEGKVESVSGIHNVTLGPKQVGQDIALLSYLSGSTPVLALYENREAEFKGKITISASSSGYSQFSDKPTSLAGINGTEGSKLSGIENNATAGATWGSDISGQPSDDRLLKNLVDLSDWKDGASLPLSGWTINGQQSENQIKTEEGPFGYDEVIWECTDADTASGAEGGFHTNYFDIDTNKPYRFSIWVNRLDTQDGGSYLGLYTLSQPIRHMSGTPEGNPYFVGGIDTPELNKWYLIVGYVHPENSNRTTSTGKFGIFDPDTGSLVRTGNDFKFQSGVTGLSLRAYYYYSQTVGARQRFARPRVDLVDGSEPSLAELLYDEPSVLNNKNISVMPDGSLVGGGGGQVTIGGLGYLGDMDATSGATWGDNISGQPGDRDLLNISEEDDITVIPNPEGGRLSLNGNHTGAIKITLPNDYIGTMLLMDVEVYNYSTSTSFVATVGGYIYAPTRTWINTTAIINGADEVANHPIRYGDDGNNCVIWIGDLSQSWSYPKVTVKNFKAGFQYFESSRWKDGWTVTIAQSFDNVKYTRTDTLGVSHDTMNVAGVTASTVIANITQALSEVAQAQSTADGKIDTFYQSMSPNGASLGDLWINTSQNNRLYRHDGSSWIATDDTRIAQAISAAQTAQTTADGKAVTFFTTSTPTAEGVGDLWFNTNTLLLKRWDGSSWQDIANAFTNTNQLTDGAGLGNTAVWSSVTGANRPQDNATVGATWGSNITGQPSNNDILNTNQQWSDVVGSGRPADNADVTDYADLRISNNYAAPAALVASSGMQLYGSKVVKSAASSAYDEGARSIKMYRSGAYTSWIVPKIIRALIGLSETPSQDNHYASITYSVYLTSTGDVHLYNGSNHVDQIGTYVAGDSFAMEYDNYSLTIYKNGEVLNTRVVPSNMKLGFDSSFYYQGDTIEDIQFGPITANDWGSIGGLPDRFSDSPSLGLNLTSNYLGYYDGSNMTSYIDNAGNFRFWGDANSFISWNGSTLQVRGDVLATSIQANLSISAPVITGGSINGNAITGGTITGTTINGTVINGTTINGGTINGTEIVGSSIKTDSGNSERIEISETENSLTSYFDDGSGLGARVIIGKTESSLVNYGMVVDTFDSDSALFNSRKGNGLRGTTYAEDQNKAGVLGTANNALGVFGWSSYGVGVTGAGFYRGSLAFNNREGGYGNFVGLVPALITKTEALSVSYLKGHSVKVTGYYHSGHGFLFFVELCDTHLGIDALGVIANHNTASLDSIEVMTQLPQLNSGTYTQHKDSHELVHVAVSGVVPARVSAEGGQVSPGIVLSPTANSHGVLVRTGHQGSHVFGKALGTVSSGTATIPVLIGSV